VTPTFEAEEIGLGDGVVSWSSPGGFNRMLHSWAMFCERVADHILSATGPLPLSRFVFIDLTSTVANSHYGVTGAMR
jgi:hypothetical protein